jgi:hypothetical protein
LDRRSTPGGAAVTKLVLAAPPKPVGAMTDAERRAWTRAIAEKLAAGSPGHS